MITHIDQCFSLNLQGRFTKNYKSCAMFIIEDYENYPDAASDFLEKDKHKICCTESLFHV